jgi:hypothetical protein
MSDTETDVRPGTYLTVVRPHQLRRGDVYTETFSNEGLGSNSRDVVIEKVTYGTVFYRGALVPVLFVYGYDDRMKRKVIYTWTSWRFVEIARTGEPPQFRRNRNVVLGTPSPEPFVY